MLQRLRLLSLRSVCACGRALHRHFSLPSVKNSLVSIKKKAKAKAKDGLHERIISALVVNQPGPYSNSYEVKSKLTLILSTCLHFLAGTLAQIAAGFSYADQNITGLCVRSTVVPELSRVNISCFLCDQEILSLKKRLRALVAVTFFHLTTINFCISNKQLLLRSQVLLQIRRDPRRQRQLVRVLSAFHAEVIVPHDEQDAASDYPLAAMNDDGSVDKDGALYSHSSAASATQFLTFADDPNKVVQFINALTKEGIRILETQTCGPCP